MIHRPFLALLVAAGLAAAPRPAAPQDSYVLFHQVFGEWTVLCGENRANGDRSCSLTAPPPRLDLGGRTNELSVAVPAPGAAAVTVRVRQVADPALPVFLRVDANDPYQTFIAGGTATWSDADAERIVAELRAGAAVIIRVHGVDGTPTDVTLSLAGFATAHDTYQRVLRTQGLL